MKRGRRYEQLPPLNRQALAAKRRAARKVDRRISESAEWKRLTGRSGTGQGTGHSDIGADGEKAAGWGAERTDSFRTKGE